MSERITINLEKAMKLLGDSGWGIRDTDCDADTRTPDDVSFDGLGGLSAGYAQLLTSTFIESIIEGADAALLKLTCTAIARFTDDFCAGIWPRPFGAISPLYAQLPLAPADSNPRPIDLLAAGAVFYDAASALGSSELGKALNEAAIRLLLAALT